MKIKKQKRKESLIGYTSLPETGLLDWQYDPLTDSYRPNVYACRRRYKKQGVIHKVRVTVEVL